MTRLIKPDISYPDRYFSGYRPSWSQHGSLYISDQHAGIFARTESLDGWQTPGDTLKLFEMAYYAGDAILEIGMYSGRSAIVEIL
jgi:hypothetical protein